MFTIVDLFWQFIFVVGPWIQQKSSFKKTCLKKKRGLCGYSNVSERKYGQSPQHDRPTTVLKPFSHVAKCFHGKKKNIFFFQGPFFTSSSIWSSAKISFLKNLDLWWDILGIVLSLSQICFWRYIFWIVPFRMAGPFPTTIRSSFLLLLSAEILEFSLWIVVFNFWNFFNTNNLNLKYEKV